MSEEGISFEQDHAEIIHFFDICNTLMAQPGVFLNKHPPQAEGPTLNGQGSGHICADGGCCKGRCGHHSRAEGNQPEQQQSKSKFA